MGEYAVSICGKDTSILNSMQTSIFMDNFNNVK